MVALARLVEPTLERDVQHYLIKTAKAYDMFAVKTKAVGQRGFPDVLIAHRGNVWFVECKVKDGKQEPMQSLLHERMRSQGVNVMTVYGIHEAGNFLIRLSMLAAIRKELAK